MNQCSIGRCDIPCGGRIRFLDAFPPGKRFQNKRRARNVSSPRRAHASGRQIAVFLSASAACDREKMRSPGGVGGTAQRKRRTGRGGGKNISRRREFPFFFSSHSSPPSLSFVYLFSLSICPSRISSPPPLQRRVARTGLDDTRRIPHLLKGSRHGGGVTVQEPAAPKGLILERDCGL